MAVGSIAGAGNLGLAQLALRQSIEQEKLVLELVNQAQQRGVTLASAASQGRGTVLDIIV